jgi:hypothetical protein
MHSVDFEILDRMMVLFVLLVIAIIVGYWWK